MMTILKKIKRLLITAVAVTLLTTACGNGGDAEVTERDLKVLRQEVAEYREMVQRLEDKQQLADSERDANLTAFNSLSEAIGEIVQKRTALEAERDDLLSDIGREQAAVIGPTDRMDSVLEYYHDLYYIEENEASFGTYEEISLNLRQVAYWLSDYGVMPYVDAQSDKIYFDRDGDFVSAMKPWYPVDPSVIESPEAFSNYLMTVFFSEDAKEIFNSYITFDPEADSKLLILNDQLYTKVPDELWVEAEPDEQMKVSRLHRISNDEAVFRMLYPMNDPDESSMEVNLYEERHTFQKVGGKWRVNINALDDLFIWHKDMLPIHEQKEASVSYWYVKEFADELDGLFSQGVTRSALKQAVSDKVHIIPDDKGVFTGYGAKASYAEIIVYNGGDLPMYLNSGDVFEVIDGDGLPDVFKVGGVYSDSFEIGNAETIRWMKNEEILFSPPQFIHNFIASGKVGMYAIVMYDAYGRFHSADYVYQESDGSLNRVTYDRSGYRQEFFDLDPATGYREVTANED